MHDAVRRGWLSLVLPLLLGAAAEGAELSVNGHDQATVQLGAKVQLSVSGTPGKQLYLLLDSQPGPAILFGQQVEIGLSPQLVLIDAGVLPPSGTLTITPTVPQQAALAGVTVYMLALVLDDTMPLGLDFSNGAALKLGDGRVDLAGNSLPGVPHFEFVRAFNQGAPVEMAIDPARYPYAAGRTGDVYVTEHKVAAQWDAHPPLIDVTGGAETVTFSAADLPSNIVQLDAGTLSGAAGAGLGVGYDVVIDFNRNGIYDAGDFLDGYGDEAGLYVVHDVTQAGPYAVTETTYSGGDFLGQDLYYPSNIATLGQLPLVVVSHGNGHQYTWYDHIGFHLASYGYIVMSHQNNTVPGTLTASTTTLTNTDFLLGNLPAIAGGALVGHLDSSRITWIGHSRGGEGVVRAYHRVLTGNYVPMHFTAADIRLISSIAPTDFAGPSETHPHAVNYHLWVGLADNDVSGCASGNVLQSYHLHDRAEDVRQSIALYGVGHGDFHAGGGSSVASGPCLVGRPTTHTLMRGYLLPLVKHYIEGNVPAKDFLWRPWERFHPIGAPALNPCVVVNLMYRDSVDSGKFVIDDFQTNPSPATSSSGGAVTATVTALTEGRQDDGNTNFSHLVTDPWNSVTLASNLDTSRGAIFEFDGNDARLAFEILPQDRDFRGFRYLSLRAAQASRHPLTTAVLGDLLFDVTLTDGKGNQATLSAGAYGGGVEEPYQRLNCGTGVGWNAEYETIRLRLADFTVNATALDLGDIREVALDVGPSHGANQGRIGVDDLELTTD